MFSTPKRPEIDHRTIRLMVGVIALTLAPLTSFFAENSIQSISASYYEGGWSQTIFIGFVFAISAFLLAYNGTSRHEMLLGKVAAGAALGIAMFPCRCETHTEIIPYLHGICAAVMFIILALFCYIFFQRARNKGHTQAKRRAYLYAISGITIVTSVLTIAIDNLSGGVISSKIVRLAFYGEFAGLIAFGVSWLTASRVLPFITSMEDRVR